MKRAAALLGCAALAAATLAGCASRPVQAPVFDRAPPPAVAPAVVPPADTRPELYTVQRGDTMYSIALDHGLDYKELAAWNNVGEQYRIRPGQQLRIKPPAGGRDALVTVSPVTTSGRVETRPLGAGAAPTPAPDARGEAKPGLATGQVAAEGAIKSRPLARKLPYSPENLALLQRDEARPGPAPAPVLAPATAPAVAPAQEPAGKPDAVAPDEDKVDWGWPARGQIIAGFSEATNKGLDIAGKPGDPVIASAPGRVVYSGSGLRGYGKLVIIKHNKTYLSAYAHNSEILVKEGQSVVKGQKIAEVGSTDSDRPKLHFEIRKLGKPVDPAKYLPPA